jgi:hypothetical protein
MKRLNFLLEKSGAYATILGRKLAKQQEEAREKAAVIDKLNEQDRVEEQQVDTKRTTRKTRRNTNNTTASKKRKTNDADYQLTDYLKEDVTIYKRIHSHGAFLFKYALYRMLKDVSNLITASLKPLRRKRQTMQE